MDEDTENQQLHKPNAPGNGRANRPVLDLLLGVLDAHQVVDHPEVAVVEVGEEQRTDTGSEGAQDNAGPGGLDDGSADTGGSDHSHRAGALNKPNQGGNDKGQDDDGNGGFGHLLGNVIAGAADLKDVAQGAAGASHQHDEAGALDALVHLVDALVLGHILAQDKDGKQQPNAHSDDGGAQEAHYPAQRGF